MPEGEYIYIYICLCDLGYGAGMTAVRRTEVCWAHGTSGVCWAQRPPRYAHAGSGLQALWCSDPWTLPWTLHGPCMDPARVSGLFLMLLIIRIIPGCVASCYYYRIIIIRVLIIQSITYSIVLSPVLLVS